MTVKEKILLGILGLVVLGSATVTAKKILSVPRGIRNNNPGNLRDTLIAWKGEVPLHLKKDKEFEEFTKMKFGVRALLKDISGDIKKGQNTIVKLISAYAPSSENDTESYIGAVVKATGFTRYQTLKAEKEYLFRLSKAIARHETGKDVINRELFEIAYSLM